MKIISYKDAEASRFDQGPAKGVTGRVLIGKDDGASNFCMRSFEVEPGGHSPRHTHDWEHEIFFHSGKGEVLKDGRWTEVSPGTAVFIPPNLEHQIRNPDTEKPLHFICLIPKGAPEL